MLMTVKMAPDGWGFSQRNMDAKQREDENLRHQRHAVAMATLMQDSKNDCQRVCIKWPKKLGTRMRAVAW